MQPCAHCGHKNREGVVFCEQCGIALLPMPLGTRALGNEAGPPAGTAELGPEGVVILQVGESESSIAVQVRQEIILGRVTEHSTGITYINLEPHDADECGVSRRHARLLRDGNTLYLMDLNSTNGTHLNGEPLPPAVEQRLRDGDEIMLGRLRLYIYFEP